VKAQSTNHTSDRLERLLAQGRLGGYLSGSCPKLRIDSYRVLAFGNDLDGLLYLDVYHASADDTQLVGMEFLISPSMDILRSVSYSGGFRPPSKATITAREVFNEILKPCRSRYLLQRESSQECDFRGHRCRYTYEMTPNEEREVIALKTGHGWETIHEVRFTAR
jgi:hypothetical protein